MEQNFTITEPFQLELLAPARRDKRTTSSRGAKNSRVDGNCERRRTAPNRSARCEKDDAVPGSLSVRAGPTDTQAAMALKQLELPE